MNPPSSPNPPPLPPNSRPSSFARQAASGSLIAPLLAIAVRAITLSATEGSSTTKTIVACVTIALILIGFVLAIIALGRAQTYGADGTVGKSIAGLAINGAIVAFFIIGFISGYSKRVQARRDALDDIQTAAQEIRGDVKNSFDPEKGITNVDAHQLDHLQQQLQGAAQKLSGDDAILMQVMAAQVNRMQTSLQRYQSSVGNLRDTHVLTQLDIKNKQDLASRREVVKRFLAANDDLKRVIDNSESNIRSDLVNRKIAASKIDAVIAGYHSKAAVANLTTSQIRKCDDRMGNALIGALNLLEEQWGNWNYNTAADQIRFQNNAAADAYSQFITEIQDASEKQLELQRKLVTLQ
jgi:hypothetical protein